MPTHAFLLSAFVPALAAVARIALHGEVGTLALLIWLAGLVPVFLLTRYMGWRGALLGLVWTSAMVVLAELFAALLAGSSPEWSLAGVVVAVTASAALAAGLERQWWAEGPQRVPAAPERDRQCAEGLPSGEILDYFLDKLFEAARRTPPLSIILFAVDRYDEYTELYGETKACAAMEVAVNALQAQTRASNVYGRVDDRTLIVVLQGEGLAVAHAFSNRVLEEATLQPVPWSGRITLSGGAAGYDPTMQASETLVAQARQALETAQRMGGERVVISKGASEETLVAPGMVILHSDGQVREIRETV